MKEAGTLIDIEELWSLLERARRTLLVSVQQAEVVRAQEDEGLHVQTEFVFRGGRGESDLTTDQNLAVAKSEFINLLQQIKEYYLKANRDFRGEYGIRYGAEAAEFALYVCSQVDLLESVLENLRVYAQVNR